MSRLPVTKQAGATETATASYKSYRTGPVIAGEQGRSAWSGGDAESEAETGSVCRINCDADQAIFESRQLLPGLPSVLSCGAIADADFAGSGASASTRSVAISRRESGINNV